MPEDPNQTFDPQQLPQLLLLAAIVGEQFAHDPVARGAALSELHSISTHPAYANGIVHFFGESNLTKSTVLRWTKLRGDLWSQNSIPGSPQSTGG